jgi:hypothetical protein
MTKEEIDISISENSSFQNKIIIGVSGYARSGKNTLSEVIKNYCLSKSIDAKIFSFAFALRLDLNSFCKEKFNISAFTEQTEEKTKIRPLLISYGEVQRRISKGSYWWNKLKPEINNFFKNGGDVAIISDLRFKEYDFDEIDFIRSYPNNLIYCVTRKNEHGEIVPAAHESEVENFPKICKKADVHLTWETVDVNSQELVFNSLPVLNSLSKRISNCLNNDKKES